MFKYKNKELVLESNSKALTLNEIFKVYGPTPIYLYDLSGFRKRLKSFMSALTGVSVHYALKANHNSEILRVVKEEGAGIDVVSGGELRLALESGFLPSQILFSGVGKTLNEIDEAISKSIKQINLESIPELKRVIERAKKIGLKANIALRINPDVDPETHPYIKTGFRENKFGIDSSDLPRAVELVKSNEAYLNFCGVTIHIGSQIRNMDSFSEAIKKSLDIVSHIESQGLLVKRFDIGGGLGIDYKNAGESDLEDLESYAAVVRKAFEGKDLEVLCEPGRFLVARFGVLLSQIQYVKKTPHKKFIILNTGMHHLMRPALYQAYHRILPLKESDNMAPQAQFDVVGPICESSDVLGQERVFTEDIQELEGLAIMDAGAYGFVMNNSYNLNPAPLEVVVEDGEVLK